MDDVKNSLHKEDSKYAKTIWGRALPVPRYFLYSVCRPDLLTPHRCFESLDSVSKCFLLGCTRSLLLPLIWCPVITHPRLPLSKHALQWYYTGTASLSITPIGLTSRSAPPWYHAALIVYAGILLASRILLIRAPANPPSIVPIRLFFVPSCWHNCISAWTRLQ